MAKAPRVEVITDQHFASWGKNLDDAIHSALEAHTMELVVAARGRDSGYQYAPKLEPLPVERTTRGFTAGIGDSDWKANWFEKGTAAHSNKSGVRGQHSLTAKGRKRRKSAGLVSGVKAAHRLRNADFAMRTALIARLRAHMGRARTGMRL